jgi:hypothetical protein
MKHKITKNELKYIIDNYSSMGQKHMTDRFNITVGQLYWIRIKYKLKVSDEAKSKICEFAFRKEPNQYNVNHLNFTTVTSSEVAYILGFLWADGCISSYRKGHAEIRCKIIKSDADDIEPTFNKTGNWKKYNYEYPTKKWKPTSTFSTNNKFLYEFLMSMDYNEKSEKTADKILGMIPLNLRKYWWRGYFDGDGSIYTKGKNTSQLILAGSFTQDWNFVKQLFSDIDITNYRINKLISNRGHSSSNVRICAKQEVFSFLNYIYDGREVDGIGLNRKYLKFKNFDFSIGVKKFNNPYGVRQRKNGNFCAVISKSKKMGFDNDIYLGEFNTCLEAQNKVIQYIHSVEKMVPNQTPEFSECSYVSEIKNPIISDRIVN